MAQSKPEYESIDEYSNIASQLINKYPEVFGQLDVDKIKCVAITNKERSDRKPLWEVRSVPYPIRMDCPYAYYIIVYMSDWVELDDAHKAALVAASLHAIPFESDKEGKVNQPDMKDYSNMLRTMGVDYMDSPDIPNLLTDEVEWKVR